MADSKRVSGRSTTATISGRASAASGRLAPQAPASARMVQAQGSGPGTQPLQAAQQPASSRHSSRDSARKKTARVGRELIVAAGVLVLMGCAAVGVYFFKQSEIRQRNRIIQEREAGYKANIGLAQNIWEKAKNAGLLYVMGKEDADEAKLFGPFQNDKQVYNVIYSRDQKDRRSRDKHESKLMNNKSSVSATTVGDNDNPVCKVNYGFADGTTPIVIAAGNIKPAEGDLANMGGTITVIVYGKADYRFEDLLKRNENKAEKSEKEPK